jgi:putative phosphonate catabolism associated alcohol dehydrogenase
MEKSKIAVFRSAGEPMTIEEVEIPDLEPGQILVRNEYTTLCRSDLYTFSGKRKEKTPTILGHEIVGRIVDFGPQTPRTDQRSHQLQAGDRISWAIYASDPDDQLSRAGIPQKAADLCKYGHEQIGAGNHLHGGLSEYIILRANTPVLKVDEAVPVPVVAIINCAVATVAGALRLAGEVAGKNVLISGVGMLGMIACAMAKSRGAASVTALDIAPDRLTKAKDYGADHTFLFDRDLESSVHTQFGRSNPFQLVIEISGVVAAIERTLPLLDIGGSAIWVGATYPQPPLPIVAEQIVRNLWTIRGLHNYNREDFIAAVEFIERHHADFPFTDMVHDQFSLSQVNEAFAYALENNPFRVGVRIGH